MANNKRDQLRSEAASELAQQRPQPDWIDVNYSELAGVYKSIPERSQLPQEYNEHLVVELYSK